MMNQARQTLQDIFGFSQFRTPQDEVVETLLHGQDALVVMPTGGGKSLCYQLPSLVRPGVGVIISPLIALMQDQVSAMMQLGVKAGCLNSSIDFATLQNTEQQLLNGDLDLIYIAPERLLQPRTLDLISRCHIALFAIDEAHCVSQWGHDFRPEYLRLSALAERFPQVPRVALTATADTRTQKEIIDRLSLVNPREFIQGFDRPNIRYRIGQKDRAKEQLLSFLKDEHPKDAGVVYCLSRKRVEDTAQWLSERGFDALPYHAGLAPEIRQSNQHKFLTQDSVIMVATVAFGMGIDKPNVRFVAHLDLPKSIEAYYQETGRAGRDGLAADAWMVYGLQDVIFLRQMLESSQGNEQHKKVERQKLEAMLGLCEITSCRRQALLSYFGEDNHKPCGNCDACLEPVPTWDGTEAARKALSAVYRTGQTYGVTYVIDTLVGTLNDRVQAAGHHKLSTFGIGKELNKKQWRSVFRQLVAASHLNVDAEGQGVLRLGDKCRALLRGEDTIQLRQDKVKQSHYDRDRSPQQKLDATEYALWNALRATRKSLADELDVPPYVIFHDATLMEMVMNRPMNASQMRRIAGIGQRKLDQFGDTFLSVIQEYDTPAEGGATDQAGEVRALYQSGMTVEQVARNTHLSPQAVYGHLARFIAAGDMLLSDVVDLPQKEIQRIEQAITTCEDSHGKSLKPVYELLDSAYDMGILRCIRASLG